MPFSRQMRSKSTSTAGLGEPAGEDLPVVREDLIGHAMGAKCLGEDPAHARALALAISPEATQNLECRRHR